MSKKKIKEIFIGSNNKGKLKEIANLLPKSLKIYSNLDYKIPSPKETGTTFKQNSLL
ncbi:non-canonical purine NTP pyrophosphatase, partial [Candidatus Pelagibacter sp.]|nr:non-canonical purine NTP pyrophosphatase [Candidatus Pelagibacter sp.]